MKTIKELKEKILKEVDAVFDIDTSEMTYEEEEKLNERFLKPLREIGAMGESEEVMSVLFEFLSESGSNDLREGAFDILETMSHSKIAEVLLEWLNGKDKEKYELAVGAVSTIDTIISGRRVFANSGDNKEKPGQFPLMDEFNKPGGIIDRIIEVYEKDENVFNKSKAVSILGGIGTDVRKIKPILEDALNHPSSWVYDDAEYALECLAKYNRK